MLLFSEECTFNLSFRPFFFCSGYATSAPTKRKNHTETHARAKFFLIAWRLWCDVPYVSGARACVPDHEGVALGSCHCP